MKVCVIPIYRKLQFSELLRIQISIANLEKTEINFVGPKELKNYSNLIHDKNYIGFDDRFFFSRSSYNQLLISSDFYEKFSDFDSMLVLQPDSIIHSKIKNIEHKIVEYDYVGAAWFPMIKLIKIGSNLRKSPILGRVYPSTTLTVGNGGLSFRNIFAMKESIAFMKKELNTATEYLNEDILFAYSLKKIGFNVPDQNVSECFFRDDSISLDTKITEFYGIHGFNKFNTSLLSYLYKEILRINPEIEIKF